MRETIGLLSCFLRGCPRIRQVKLANEYVRLSVLAGGRVISIHCVRNEVPRRMSALKVEFLWRGGSKGSIGSVLLRSVNLSRAFVVSSVV